LGQGLLDELGSVAIESLDVARGLVGTRLRGGLAERFPELAATELVVYTVHDGEIVVATTCCESIGAGLTRASGSA
jgi:hypothetical protein